MHNNPVEVLRVFALLLVNRFAIQKVQDSNMKKKLNKKNKRRKTRQVYTVEGSN